MNLQRSRGILLFLLLAIFLMASGCGGYAYQAEKYRALAKSDLAAAAYVLQRFHSGAVSGPYVRVSVREYAKAIRTTGRGMRQLVPPPAAEAEHIRTVAALSGAQSQMQAIGQEGVEPRKALGSVHRLQALAKVLGP